MRHPSADVTPRSSFLGLLAGGLAALAGGGLLARDLAAQGAAQTAAPAATPRAPTSAAWDMSWVERVKGAHRQVFDAPEIADAVALHQARTWMNDFAEVYGVKDADTSAVLVIRHAAIPMVLNDALWDELELGKAAASLAADGKEARDPATGQPARRNPFLNANVRPGDRHAVRYVWPDGGLDTLLARGAIVLACNLALRHPIAMVARRDGVSAEAARAKVLANLLPGVVVMPSGIFAVGRAQEAGCHYIRAT